MMGEMWWAPLQAYIISTCRQCLSNYSNCQRGETKVPHCSFNVVHKYQWCEIISLQNFQDVSYLWMIHWIIYFSPSGWSFLFLSKRNIFKNLSGFSDFHFVFLMIQHTVCGLTMHINKTLWSMGHLSRHGVTYTYMLEHILPPILYHTIGRCMIPCLLLIQRGV